MKTEQLVSEGIHHPGSALDQRIRLLDELNSYWLPIYILFNQFDRPVNLPTSLKEIRESTMELYDTRTGETVDDIPICLRDVYLETPSSESFYRLLQYLDGVPKIDTVLPHFYASSFDNEFNSQSFMNSSINVTWKEGHDLSYLKVRLSEGLNKLFDEFEILRSLHESFSTKTPPKVPIQILIQFRNLKNWKRFLVPMGLDIYSVRSDKDYFFRLPSYYITNVHRLDDLVAQVPKEYLTGIIEMTNDIITEDLKGVGFKPYKLPFKQEEVTEEVPTLPVPEPTFKDHISAAMASLSPNLRCLLECAVLLVLISGIVFPLLYFLGK